MNSLSSRRDAPLSRSLDGYIRIPFDAFSSLVFCQRRAWHDLQLRDELLQENLPAFHAGYCEWATDKLPDQVSVGWSWFRSIDGCTLLAPGGVASNLMFVAHGFGDLGPNRTHELLQSWLTGEPWQLDVLASSDASLYPAHRSLN